jgi:uncharacterized membrane protein
MIDILIMLFFMSFFTICLIVLLVIGLYSIWVNVKTSDLEESDKRIFK